MFGLSNETPVFFCMYLPPYRKYLKSFFSKYNFIAQFCVLLKHMTKDQKSILVP